MGGKDGETSAGRLVLVGSSQGPESNGPTTELGEPALQLRLGCVVRETTHVQDFATLGEESPHVGTSIHGTGEDVGVLLRRLRLADKTTKDSGQGDSLFHRTTRRGGCKSLQMEWKVVLDGCRGLDGFDLESGTDVRQGAGAKG